MFMSVNKAFTKNILIVLFKIMEADQKMEVTSTDIRWLPWLEAYGIQA